MLKKTILVALAILLASGTALADPTQGNGIGLKTTTPSNLNGTGK